MNFDDVILQGIKLQLDELKVEGTDKIVTPNTGYNMPLKLVELRPLFTRDLQARETIPAAFVSIANVQTTPRSSGDLGSITVITDYVIETILHQGYGPPKKNDDMKAEDLTPQFTRLKTDYYRLLNLNTITQIEGITEAPISIADGTGIAVMAQEDNQGKPLQQIMTHLRIVYNQPYDQTGEELFGEGGMIDV